MNINEGPDALINAVGDKTPAPSAKTFRPREFVLNISAIPLQNLFACAQMCTQACFCSCVRRRKLN